MLRLGFDIDGVLANQMQAMNKYLGRPEGNDPNWKPQNWNWLVDDFKLSSSYSSAMWSGFAEAPDVYLDMDIMPGAEDLKDFQIEMHEKKVPIEYYYITARKGTTALQQTKEWMEEHHLLHDGSVILCPRKGELAKALQLDFYIDDNLAAAESIWLHQTKLGYLLDAPYNQGIGKFQRVTTVKQFLDDVRGYVKLL
jgi:uncharacterized HAD superfamily protein